MPAERENAPARRSAKDRMSLEEHVSEGKDAPPKAKDRSAFAPRSYGRSAYTRFTITKLAYLRAIFLRPNTPRPIRAEPSTAIVAGSGVGICAAGEFKVIAPEIELPL